MHIGIRTIKRNRERAQATGVKGVDNILIVSDLCCMRIRLLYCLSVPAPSGERSCRQHRLSERALGLFVKRYGKADDIRQGIIDDVNYVKFEYSCKVA